MIGDLRNNMFKYFITHKRGETDDGIQDSVAFDLSSGRFAISDGVTQSFIPQIWSKTLVDYFINNQSDKLIIGDKLLNEFVRAREIFLNSLDEEQLFYQELVEDELENAKATFAGLQILNHEITWQVIGDSCIFIIPTNGQIKCKSSITSTIDSEGHLEMKFDNHPNYIASDGSIKGNILEGKDYLDSGWIVLMTDAISDWFVKQYNLGEDPLEQLLKLENNSDFDQLVDKECKLGRMKSDDTSVILISISNYDALKKTEPEIELTKKEIDYDELYAQILPLWMI